MGEERPNGEITVARWNDLCIGAVLVRVLSYRRGCGSELRHHADRNASAPDGQPRQTGQAETAADERQLRKEPTLFVFVNRRIPGYPRIGIQLGLLRTRGSNHLNDYLSYSGSVMA